MGGLLRRVEKCFLPALGNTFLVFQQGGAVYSQERGSAGSLRSIDSLERGEKLLGVVPVGIVLDLVSFLISPAVLHGTQFFLDFAPNLGKTEVLYQPSPTSTAHHHPTILIGDTALNTVEHFKYLDRVISSDCSLDREISARISKASQALGCLRTRVTNHKSIKLATKIKVYKAVVLTSLLHGCETWTLYRKHTRQLERFHMRSLWSIMGIKWQDRVTSLEVLDRVSLVSIETMVLKAQLPWTGHVIRMEPSRLPLQLLYGELGQDQRHRDRPKSDSKTV